jgi:hypothetical protein
LATQLRREPFQGDPAGNTQGLLLAPTIKNATLYVIVGNMMTMPIFDNAARDYVFQNNFFDKLQGLQAPRRALMTAESWARAEPTVYIVRNSL